MTPTQLRQTINQYLDQLSGDKACGFASERLRLMADFVNFLAQQERQARAASDDSDARPPAASTLLPNTATWAGDDFEDCLETVYETRSQIQA